MTGGISAYGVYKANYDPPHLVWDLDETLLHSVCPIEQALTSEVHPSDSNRFFDQIDDDFPFKKGTPNTGDQVPDKPSGSADLSVISMSSQQPRVLTQKTY